MSVKGMKQPYNQRHLIIGADKERWRWSWDAARRSCNSGNKRRGERRRSTLKQWKNSKMYKWTPIGEHLRLKPRWRGCKPRRPGRKRTMRQALGKLANLLLLQKAPPLRSHSNGLPSSSSNSSLSKSQSQVRMRCHLKGNSSRCEAVNLRIRLKLRLSTKVRRIRMKVWILCNLSVTMINSCKHSRMIYGCSVRENLLESSIMM